MAGAVMCDRAGSTETLAVRQDEQELDEDRLRAQEQAIMQLADKYAAEKQSGKLADLIRGARPFLGAVSKAKAAKVVRALVEMFLDLEGGIQSRVQLCKECIEWAKAEKRAFLRQSLEARLVALYYDAAMFGEALALGSALLKELKKLDDKNLLVEVQLLESKTYHALANLSKSRAALTSARTTANSVYCPPRVQAALDLQSGVLHAADERDFKTAYSYFYEAFEGYDSSETEKAPLALKYMLLSKIMLNQPEDVQHIVGGKLALKYAGPDIEAMKAVAKAAKDRSLADFQSCLGRYGKELEEDPVVKAHLGTLYDCMLEQNLCRIVEPYSRVEVEYVSSRIRLPVPQVEKKLSQMILDKKFNGILDQGEGVLIVFEEAVVDRTYETALETVHHMSKVVDTLYQKAKKLS